MQAHTVASHRFQDGEGPDDVGVQKRLRIVQCIVDMGFGGKMHHRVGLGHQLRNQLGVGDIALNQPDGILHVGQRLAPAGVGQGVEYGNRIVWMLTYGAVHEIRADESRATGD
ncbi:Uncharacterised protein [Mycobacterium tuberculosis]|nr:Uncharacterised protein [Mycobacterium tuberculosis]